ncbi:FAD-binding oxidoreductase [Mycobacterium sp. URHB0021]
MLLPDDDRYAAECATFNLLTPVRPAVAVGATGVADVQAAVRFAAQRDLPIAVVATGHQMVGPAEGSVLINMSRMNTRYVHARRHIARVEGGVRWQQVLGLTDRYGLAALSGSSPTVGVVGYHLGGGASPVLGRTYGYAADHVQAIEIVTADGQLRWVTAGSEPDLFCALRGGKSNFGVVTTLEFTLFPVRCVYGGGLVFAGEHASRVLHAWRQWVPHLPEQMSSSIAFLRQPPLPTVLEPMPGRFVIQVRFSSLGPPVEAESVLAPLRGVAPTMLDTIEAMRYRDADSMFLAPPVPISWVGRSTGLQRFPTEAADALLSVLGPDSGSQLAFVELRALGGGLERPPAVPNAVPGRNARWSLSASACSRPDLVPLFEEQLTTLVDTMAPWAQDEMMPNLLSARQGTTPLDLRAVYGPQRYDRLAAIKKRYDPDNLFRVNHNIVRTEDCTRTSRP